MTQEMPSVDRQAGPRVAVCVPLYRKERFIARTIESILAQTWTDFELVVVDNASPDGSADAVRSFDDPRLRLIVNPETVPPTENFARAVAASSAPLVKVVCADDLLHPRCLERQVEALAADPGLAMVTCRQDVIDGDGAVLARDRGLRKPDLVGRQQRAAVVRRLVRHGGNPIGNVNNVLFRRTAFEAAGGFPRDVDFFALDVGTWVRLLHHGDYLGLPETLTSFRIDSGSHSKGLGADAVARQRAFIASVRAAERDVVRRRDALLGALRFPLTRLRHHLIFAASGPAGSPGQVIAAKVLGIGRPPAREGVHVG